MMSFVVTVLAIIGLLNVIGLAVFLFILLIETNDGIRSYGKKRFGNNQVRLRKTWSADD